MSIDFAAGLQNSVELGYSTVKIVGDDYEITVTTKCGSFIITRPRIGKADMMLFKNIIKESHNHDSTGSREFAELVQHKIDFDTKLLQLSKLCKSGAKRSKKV